MGDKKELIKTPIAAAVLESLQDDFRADVPSFLQKHGINPDIDLRLQPGHGDAEPVFLVTGAGFTLYNPDIHGADPSYAFYAQDTGGDRYLMNNTAAVAERLLNQGKRIIVHGKDAQLMRSLLMRHPHKDCVEIIEGDLGDPQINSKIEEALAKMAGKKPVSELRMMLYQSFAQASGVPFKPLHNEPVSEVERAACKRLRFAYNMAALSYDLLVNRGQKNLHIVSLSALAGHRATYGLLADAADKFMNELFWKTFHSEANASTGKPVSVCMINPGITAACDTYHRDEVRKIVERESVADGFPLDDDVLNHDRALPEISSRDIAWVAEKALTASAQTDMNADMPLSVKALLYGGFTPEVLAEKFRQVAEGIASGHVGPQGLLPEHMFAAATSYGRLPEDVDSNKFCRISLTPPGQRF